MDQVFIVFKLGDEVYLKTDVEQRKGLVTGIMIRLGVVLYYVSIGTNESAHYEIELSKEKDYTI